MGNPNPNPNPKQVPPLVAVMGPAGWAVGGVTAVGAGGAVAYKTLTLTLTLT